jgi:preprotein translocase subunit SecD
MAVDANIIIFERVKEEYRSGKRLPVAVETGFKRSVMTIIDSNITSVLASAVLYIIGAGALKGFAITLLLGVVISMFCSLIVTRSFAKLYLYLNQNNARRFRFKQGEVLSGGKLQPKVRNRSLNK